MTPSERFERVRATVRPTTIIDSPRLKAALGVDVVLASETLQYTGSFKFRAAYNLVLGVSKDHFITASSGNFGQALAYACKLAGKRCTVVMPSTSAKVKIEGVAEFGGEVDLVDVGSKSRAERVSELSAEHPNAYVASAYDDDLVIDGNSTLGIELASYAFDYVVCPVGGGGLASGLILGLKVGGSPAKVVGAEPAMANDAARSLEAGELIRNVTEPQTIADGARTISLGDRNWEILSKGIDGIFEVPEARIAEAVRLLFSLCNLKSEPTGALSLAAVVENRERFSGQKVCCVVSGGNVDPAVYAKMIS
jgi:threonine dehydratase